MENYLVVLLLSVLVLLGAFYENTVGKRTVQIKDETEKVKEQIDTLRKEMIEKDNAYRKELDQTKENATKFKDEFVYAEIQHRNEMKKVKEEFKSMSEQIDTHHKEVIEKDNACRKEKDQMKETMKLLKETDNRHENTLSEIKKGKQTQSRIHFSLI
ncbi:unnamed protein product [Mytilus coruscus]|uniref:Uncharacterized protein n=1 Tax=Mytilus coruscus TaxID=42192 RepID=A0A6J7ZV08_MYTCO|nr:unnamed protein product [Mytilus coruscus]